MKKRNYLYLFGTFVAFCLLLFGAARPVAADSYSVSYHNDGTATLWNEPSGTVAAKLSVKGERIPVGLVVASDNIYFLSCSAGQSKSTYSIFRQNLSTGAKKRLKKLSTAAYSYRLRAHFDGSLYLESSIPGGQGYACRFTISSKEFEKIAKGVWAFGYKNRFVIDGSANAGMSSPGTFYIYDTKSKTRTVAAKNVFGKSYYGKYAFFASMASPNSMALYRKSKYKIIRYNLAKAEKKTLVASLNAYQVEKITSKYVYHRGYLSSSGKDVYYRYDIANKKNVKISKATYTKAVG